MEWDGESGEKLNVEELTWRRRRRRRNVRMTWYRRRKDTDETYRKYRKQGLVYTRKNVSLQVPAVLISTPHSRTSFFNNNNSKLLLLFPINSMTFHLYLDPSPDLLFFSSSSSSLVLVLGHISGPISSLGTPSLSHPQSPKTDNRQSTTNQQSTPSQDRHRMERAKKLNLDPLKRSAECEGRKNEGKLKRKE